MLYRRLFFLLFLLYPLTTAPARGADEPEAPKEPPPPATYAIELRYRIDAPGVARAGAFLDMMKELQSLGFKRDPADAERGEDLNEMFNPRATRLKGTIPAENARKALRDRHIQTILLFPAGAQVPAKDQPVRVHLELPAELPSERRRILRQQLLAVLERLGFQRPIGADDRGFTRLVGGIPAGRLETLLRDVRRAPESWFLLPNSLLSDLKGSPVGRRILRNTLEGWLAHEKGKELVAAMVTAWGLEKPAAEYLGSLPREVVRNPDVVQEVLLDQVQRHPAGERFLDTLFAGVRENEAGAELMDPLLRRLERNPGAVSLPLLFRDETALRVIAARPDLPLPSPRPPEQKVPDELRKLTPEVRGLLDDMAQAGAARRMEIILSHTPGELDDRWLRDLTRAAPGLVLEGRVGPVVAVRCTPTDAKALANLFVVSTIRLPRAARSAVLTLPANPVGAGLPRPFQNRLDRLRRGGVTPPLRGRKVRVAVVHGDFRGWQALIGKGLPEGTHYLDLTRERNADLRPDPFAGDANATGAGVHLARAVLLAAPEAEVTLVRIDPAAPHLMDLLLRRLNGEEFFTPSLARRGREIALARDTIHRRRRELLRERAEVLSLFPAELGVGDPRLKERVERLKKLRQDEAKLAADEKALDALLTTYLRYREDVRDLRQVRVAVSGLSWVDGHPVNGTSALSRYIDDAPLRPALWFQAAGNGRGQAWAGAFRDSDADGAMEFARAGEPTPPGDWGREANFLAWRPLTPFPSPPGGEGKGVRGQPVRDIPAGTRMRVSLQWTEAHDPSFVGPGEDPYRNPLAELRLVVLRQFDPEGAKRPAYDFEPVALWAGLPQRLRHAPDSSTYEIVVEFTVEAAGRYAVRVEGNLPSGIRPRFAATFPPAEVSAELRPRLFVETLGGAGRAVLASFVTEEGTLGVPADALRAVTVGALNSAGKPQPYGTRGPPLGATLAVKPDVWAFDRLGLAGAKQAGGTALSAALAAGYAAARLGDACSPGAVLEELRHWPRKE